MTDLATIEDRHFWFAGRDDLVLALLDRCAGPGLVADLGCGTGAFAARLADRRGSGVLALDRRTPVRRGSAPAAVADIERLPLRDASVAVVLARDVLEHVDDRDALAECRRVLEPDGVLIALVPAWPALWSERDVRAGHLRRYTRRTLDERLEASGFRVAERRGYQLALLPLVAASRVAGRRRPTDALQAEDHPPAWLNAVLTTINRAEAALATRPWPRPPTGSTLAVVARPA